MPVSRSNLFIPLLHVAVWSVLLAIPTILFWDESWLGLSASFFFISTLYHIGLFYLNVYFLYPKLLNRRWWWLYILSLVGIVILSYYVKLFILQINREFLLTHANQRVIFFSLLPILIASIIFRLINDRVRFERLEKEARAQRLDAELKFLRSQVSPHFLFNMMANMVSLARQKSDLLEPSLLRLSDLLRYMLYDSAQPKISIASEIENIENYVALQKLRFGEDMQVTMNIENNCPDCLVEPMLLLPFIENAFKHGVGMLKDPFIKIDLHVNKDAVRFNSVNNFNPENLAKDRNSGIGLVNVKNRLKLLYPGKYELKIEDKSNLFSVQLMVDLS